MALDLQHISLFGPALPEPFVKFQLEETLNKRKLLPKNAGAEGKRLQDRWAVYHRKLRDLGEHGGPMRVWNHVLEPLVERLGYDAFRREDTVATREGEEDGGWVFCASDGTRLRAWAVDLDTDLDAPNKRGRAYRFSPSRVAQRVLVAKGERVGLLTDGQELRLLLCDPARPDSHLAVRLDRGAGGWRSARQVPDSYRLLLALACPKGVQAIPELTEEARLSQSAITKKLRLQARSAIEGFIQEVLDHPRNAAEIAAWRESSEMAAELWKEGLVLVYRLLFVLKLESSADPARAFSFAATSLWRTTYSPNIALARVVRQVIDGGGDTGGLLEGGLRTLWRLFAHGLRSSELVISPLSGMLFGADATPHLDRLHWGERAVARLLDALLWTPAEGKLERESVHYGSLDVEDLGRVYEALLELEPGLTTEPMCRLRRAKLEVVVPLAQGAPYRASRAALADDEESDDEESDNEDEPKKGGKTKVQFVEEIPAGRFYLRVGLGRKASGSYYTPHPFVRFLVQETLRPQIAERSPHDEPNPLAILELNVLDPAMGSGHFLVEACRYLGDALYEACRLCDELAKEAEAKADKAKDEAERAALTARAAELRQRVIDLPDPNDELVVYLPSRVPEGEDSGLSQRKAEALCRRLVAVHCLYGVDKNPLAVELAKLSLWLESYAEGLPLTFLDHRLICGDSLTGPFFEHLLTRPGSGRSLDDLTLLRSNLTEKLQQVLAGALREVADLESTVGTNIADLEHKRLAKQRLDAALEPLKLLAAVWSGGVMLGDDCDDEGYAKLAQAVVEGGDTAALLAASPRLEQMRDLGREGVAYDLVFPEVFHPGGEAQRRGGFHAVLGNPPWDAIQPLAKEFFAAFDLRVIDAPTKKERTAVEERLLNTAATKTAWEQYNAGFEAMKRQLGRIMQHVGREADGKSSGAVSDLWQAFAERGAGVLLLGGRVGWVLPSAFHANQSATGIRDLYLSNLALQCCYSFENRKKLFEIDSRFKFAAVVAERCDSGTREFDCAFYLHDLEWLFARREGLKYTREFVLESGGQLQTLIELRAPADAQVAASCYEGKIAFGKSCEENGVRLGREMHMTDDADRFSGTGSVLKIESDPRDPLVAAELLERGYLALHEGKTFHQYTDRWEDRPRYLVALEALADKAGWLSAARFFRLAFRDIASSTNERTGIFCLLPPGVVCGNKAPCEREPDKRPNSKPLFLLAVADSFSFDFILRTKVQATVNLFILNGCPFPGLDASGERCLAHAALRLSCNHAGYAPLWVEQLGDAWREPRPQHTWPVLEGDDERWTVRAAIDAVVADAYGLDRAQYEHVLASFSHKSYPQAPTLCLAAFDELKAIGLDAFTKKHDPYWDIPLVETLPKPVIDLPGATEAADSGGAFQLSGEPETKRGRKRRGKA